jgi:hypothetical protein
MCGTGWILRGPGGAFGGIINILIGTFPEGVLSKLLNLGV